MCHRSAPTDEFLSLGAIGTNYGWHLMHGLMVADFRADSGLPSRSMSEMAA